MKDKRWVTARVERGNYDLATLQRQTLTQVNWSSSRLRNILVKQEWVNMSLSQSICEVTRKVLGYRIAVVHADHVWILKVSWRLVGGNGPKHVESHVCLRKCFMRL